MQNGNYDILEMLKYALNGQWFESEDEMILRKTPV